MVGIGEAEEDVSETMDDLLAAGCKIFTIGQYLQPAKDNMPVKEYVKPDVFEKYKKTGLEKGFEYIESSPLTRSSFHSAEQLNIINNHLKIV
jgi:lipoic acid synthetase